MVRSSSLSQRIANILATRNMSANFGIDCRIRDDGDGVQFLEFWNSSKLGVEPTQEEVDAASISQTTSQQRFISDESERLLLKQSAALMAFINMTPAEIDAWVSANVNSLADAKAALARIAKIVNVAVRRTVRNGGG